MCIKIYNYVIKQKNQMTKNFIDKLFTNLIVFDFIGYKVLTKGHIIY